LSRTHVWRRTVAGTVLSAVALAAAAATATPSTAAPAARPSASIVSTVDRIEDRTAHDLALSLADGSWRARVRTAALTSAQVDLHTLTDRAATPAGRHLSTAVSEADHGIAAAKGLPNSVGSLLRLRLGDASMRKALSAGATPLVAATPADDQVRTITAYDTRGRVHVLDARRVPDQPVYLVDTDVSKALKAGLKVIDQQLAARGLSSPKAQATATAADAGGWWSTRITSIEVSNDEEPWIKGAAEMFTLVTGFGLDGKPRVDSVDMPYLDYDGTVYRPNQILVNWANYKYNLADAVLMEDDGDTNYLSLAKALASALLTITDQGTYIPLVNALLDALPSSWWTDDPDYVDSWYTLAKNDSGRRDGARGNGWMTVEPYFVEQF
jgi:hypothetical protein